MELTQRPALGSPGQRLVLGLLLVLAVALVYHPLPDHAFIPLDDPVYIVENPHLRSGLTSESVRWALTQPYFGNRIPLTLLSYVLGVEIFGAEPGPTLLINAVLHGLATLLLFAALTRLTGAPGRSAFVAGVFAVHPLHVESVAWASERKDVLSGLFWMATLWTYARFVERPSVPRNASVCLAYLLALASKPMAITLPFVLLLLDVWPLGRLRIAPRLRWLDLRPRIAEKLPLLAMSFGATLVTYGAQRAQGAFDAAQTLPLALRIQNAVMSYLSYLEKTVWPTNLGVFYPFPESIPIWQPLSAALLLVSVSGLATYTASRRGYFFAGWFWFLGTLVPVIGLVQVGMQARADRYMYIPLIGLSIALAWGSAELSTAVRRRQTAVTPLAIAAVVTLSGLTFASSLQVRHWRDGVSLFEHTLAVTGDNPTARGNLGLALLEQDRVDEAVRELTAAFQLPVRGQRARVAVFQTLQGAGRKRHQRGDLPTAIAFYRAALAIQPDAVPLQLRLGHALLAQQRADEAQVVFLAAVESDAHMAEAHAGVAQAAEATGQPVLAARYYRQALRLRPSWRAIEQRLIVLLALHPEADE